MKAPELGRVRPEVERHAHALVAIHQQRRSDGRVLMAWAAWRRRRQLELLAQFPDLRRFRDGLAELGHAASEAAPALERLAQARGN